MQIAHPAVVSWLTKGLEEGGGTVICAPQLCQPPTSRAPPPQRSESRVNPNQTPTHRKSPLEVSSAIPTAALS